MKPEADIKKMERHIKKAVEELDQSSAEEARSTILKPEVDVKKMERRIDETAEELNQSSAEEIKCIRELRNAAEYLARTFRETADDLDKHFKNVRIARITGSSTAVIGSGVVIGAGIAAPFTMGLSLLAPIIAGTAVGVVGAGTSIGSSITGYIIRRRAQKRMDREWTQFKVVFNQQVARSKQSETMKDLLGGLIANIYGHSATFLETGKAGFMAFTWTAAPAFIRSSPRLLQGLASATVLGGFLSAGASILDIVTASIDLHKKTKCQAGEMMRCIANQLDDMVQYIDNQIHNIM